MEKLECLCDAIWQGAATENLLTEWRNPAEAVTVGEGEAIIRQMHPARYLYFLIEGAVEHSLSFEGGRDRVVVGETSMVFFPLGWSGLSAPFRYVTSAHAKTRCTLYRWPVDELNRLFYAEPAMGGRFFRFILNSVLSMLDDTRRQLKTASPSSGLLVNTLARKIPGSGCQPMTAVQIREVLGHSLFLEVFPEPYLEWLTGGVEVKHLRQGECLYRQGDAADRLMLLAAGSVAVSFKPDGATEDLFLRSYSSLGQIVATTAFSTSGVHRESAISITDVTVLCIHKSDIQRLCSDQPQFGLIWERRLLWLLSARLRTLRIQLVAQRHDEEHIVIENLLAQVSPQLGIFSKLYKLPHLLASRLTHAEALACLQDVKVNGSRLERTVASVCLDLLGELSRELEFYEGLHYVYQAVTQAPLEQSSSSVRRLCNQCFKRVFESARYVIRGTEHLPDRPGHIFLLNHLISHPYHALPNGFEFALDTHFVSAMILDSKYGDGGVRVVRRGRGDEHGHHSYYDRLGHIYVHTLESDALPESQEEAGARREAFNRLAGDYLRSGVNLIICPEGTSHWGRDSPSAFKKGVFHLAAALAPEPLIVPIAVANFDKRLKHNAVAAVVHEPFYLSAQCDPLDKQSLAGFLSDFRHVYRGYVVEAMALADAAAWAPGSAQEVHLADYLLNIPVAFEI